MLQTRRRWPASAQGYEKDGSRGGLSRMGGEVEMAYWIFSHVGSNLMTEASCPAFPVMNIGPVPFVPSVVLFVPSCPVFPVSDKSMSAQHRFGSFMPSEAVCV